MEEVKIKKLLVEPANSIMVQGNRKKVKKYINEGYSVREKNDSYWILWKIEKVTVTIEKNVTPFNIERQICEYYNKKRISQDLLDRFSYDLKEKKIKIYLGNDHLVIV